MRRHNVTILAASLVFSIGDVGSYLLPIWPPQLPTHPATLTSLLPADWWFSSIWADMYLAIPQPCCQRCVLRHILTWSSACPSSAVNACHILHNSSIRDICDHWTASSIREEQHYRRTQ